MHQNILWHWSRTLYPQSTWFPKGVVLALLLFFFFSLFSHLSIVPSTQIVSTGWKWTVESLIVNLTLVTMTSLNSLIIQNLICVPVLENVITVSHILFSRLFFFIKWNPFVFPLGLKNKSDSCLETSCHSQTFVLTHVVSILFWYKKKKFLFQWIIIVQLCCCPYHTSWNDW